MQFNKPVKRLFLGFAAFSLLVVASCTLFQRTTYETVKKSPNDKKDYRYLILPNGLKVLLISDDNADIASASMDVFVGSMDDPKDRQGLAHFVEHMLFLGTKKYPDPGEYSSFIKSHGGSNNAFTSAEHTNYHFDIKSDALAKGLDRFAQFFIAPSFDKQYVNREIHAIDSEYKAKIKDDNRRRLDVYKNLVNPDNPWRQFSVGNLETLQEKDPKLLPAMKAFYKKYYTADNMTLVVNGKMSLDVLQQMVESDFSEIPSGKVKKKPFTQPLFAKNFLPKWVTIQPEKNLKELSLVFPMPDYQQYYSAKPLVLVGHILGHEGRGSLYAYLKKNHWIESLVAGELISYNGGDAFSVSVELTDEGLNHQQEIVKAVFEAIARLKKDGIPRWVFDELAEINHLTYLYPQETSPMSRAIYYSTAMHDYPAKDLLQASTMLESYNPKLVGDILSYLTPSNVFVSVMAHGFTFVEHSPYYQVPYTVSNFPRDLKEVIEAGEVNEEIVMPEKNTLLPDYVGLPEIDSEQRFPEKVIDNDHLEVWYKPVVNFRAPRASQYFSFQKYREDRTIVDDLALDLYVGLINDSLEPFVYPAYLAGIDFSVYRQAFGINFHIAGFSDKQNTLLKQIVSHVKKTTFTEKQFERIKQEAVRKVANLKFEQPYRRLLTEWQQKMRPQLWPYERVQEVLKTVTLKNVNEAAEMFWQNAGLVTLSSGALSETQAKESALYLQKTLQIKAGSIKNTKIEITKLGTPSYDDVETPYSDYGYLYYWQASNDSVIAQANWLLLGKLLEPSYFHDLRTEQQLGYIVFANYYPLINVPGIIFVVQSPKADVESIHHSTLKFLDIAFKGLPKLSEKTFKNYQMALVEQLSEKPKNLQQETAGYWGNIVYGFPFDRKEILAKAIKKVDFSIWKNVMSDAYASMPLRTLLMGTQAESNLGQYQSIFKNDNAKNTLYIFRRSHEK